jgi:hypothetical protein
MECRMRTVCAFLENKPQIAGLGNVVLGASHPAYTLFDQPIHQAQRERQRSLYCLAPNTAELESGRK